MYPLSGTMVADYDRFEGVWKQVNRCDQASQSQTLQVIPNNPPFQRLLASGIPTGDGGACSYINGAWMAHGR